MILCEANILLFSFFFFFVFFWLGKPSAAYSSRLTSDILTSTSGFFLHVYQVVLCILLCFSSWDILLLAGPLCLWRFFSKKSPGQFFFTVLMLKKLKRRWADSCKYTCTHSCRTLIWFPFFFFFKYKYKSGHYSSHFTEKRYFSASSLTYLSSPVIVFILILLFFSPPLPRIIVVLLLSVQKWSQFLRVRSCVDSTCIRKLSVYIIQNKKTKKKTDKNSS